MAKPILLTDFQDDVISESMNGKRRYRMENNTDGTISLEDVTEYEKVGNSYGAGQINVTNEAVNQSLDANKLIKDLDAIGALTEEGYAPDALAVKALNDSLTNVEKLNSSIISTAGTHTVKNMSDYKMLILCLVGGNTSDNWETSHMVPYNYFKTRNSTDKQVYIGVHSGSNPPSVLFNYVSDTQVNITNLSANRGFNIYGVK